ncbi:ABC-F family ATP-binding cassette domain-containing protein [Blastochloris viridis]|uniref:ABC transporter ATP-binding protein uup n=1 Tax=Blastochloris viridis TaxID=1079 RepID=A0A0H5B7S7_BLAVI|nr:ABC-F family ATP-binding cassette domain-containing protein [Blastochloris viridis]ALK08484.1 putative ABC transporter ATP-binding protein YheS [Blastochloris viridis]BAR98232.1 ABC transporter ATP-binding protein uup [Blastochloris viridis]CUU41146.1 putative ABC transporter ATP-binding protein YheS [Blastochloris viridis]
MLTIDSITVRIAGRVLLENASAQIPTGGHVGLVGRNGAGKTTLFRAICGEHPTDAGRISLPPRARIGRVAQEAPSGPEALIDVVLAADTERAALITESATATDPHRIAEIETRLADIGAHSAPARAARILAGLGFDEAAQQRPCSDFSGGWRMRVALAAVLFAEPDLLLLDEPTNYLDLEGTLWLQDYLGRYPHTVLIISHDRDLLDQAVDWTLHLGEGRLTLWRGGYSAFERLRAEKQMLDARLRKRQDTERKHLQAFVDRFRYKATKARQAQSRMKMLEKLVPLPALVAEDTVPIVIPAPARLPSPPIIALDGVSVGYAPDRPVLRGLDLRIDTEDRIALLGSNGNGKSTLAKLITGRLAPLAGRMTVADKLEIAYFAQHQLDELRPKESPCEHVRALMRTAGEAEVRAKTAQIGFPGERADTPVEKLSGGEKARLLLGLATFRGPHLLVLDEPTNHLDVDARDALASAINDFPGAVILISHDRHLIAATVDQLWLVGGGTVTSFDGDLDDYRKLVLARASGDSAPRQQADSRPSRAEERRSAAERRTAAAPIKKRVTAAEKEIAARETEIAEIDATLANGDIYTRDPAKATRLAKQRADAATKLAAAEEAWLEATAEYEAATAG